MTLKPGDSVIVIETWDYGPPADPYREFMVLQPGRYDHEDSCKIADREGHIYHVPRECLHKPDPITFGDLCAFFGVSFGKPDRLNHNRGACLVEQTVRRAPWHLQG
jgi:hypothetical protein